jgi:hypothetical protein
MTKTFHPSLIKHRTIPRRMLGSGYGSFLLGNTLGGLQEADGTQSALSGKGLGMGMCGTGMTQINKKLENLMIKASKPKPKNIKFNM